MSQGGVYIGGKTVFPEIGNWELYAKQAIDEARQKNPFVDNATQLAIMNAVKESAGVVDNASPFHTSSPGSFDAISNIDYEVNPIADATYNVGTFTKNTLGFDLSATAQTFDNGLSAVVGGVKDSFSAAKNSLPEWADLSSLTSELRTGIILALVLGTVLVLSYGVHVAKE